MKQNYSSIDVSRVTPFYLATILVASVVFASGCSKPGGSQVVSDPPVPEVAQNPSKAEAEQALVKAMATVSETVGNVKNLKITDIRWGNPYSAGAVDMGGPPGMSPFEAPRAGQVVHPVDIRYEFEVFGNNFNPRFHEESKAHTRFLFFLDSMGDLAAFPLVELPD